MGYATGNTRHTMLIFVHQARDEDLSTVLIIDMAGDMFVAPPSA